MKIKTTFILALLASFQSMVALGQDSDSVLTFRKAVRLGLNQNAALRTEKNNLVESKMFRTASIAGLGPQAYVNASAYRSNGNSFIQQEAKVVNATVDGVQASLNVSQPILGGFSQLNTARSSDALLDAQLELVNRSQQDVINTVAARFLQVLLDAELLKIAEENLAAQQKQYEQTKAEVELGGRSPVDEYNQQALVSNAELAVAQAEYTLISNRTLLMETIMSDPRAFTEVKEPDWDVNRLALDNPDLEQMLSVAAESRSDLKQARHLEEASKLSVSAARGAYFPTLSAFYNNGSAYNQLKGADKNAAGYRSFDQQFFTDNRFNSFGLSLYVPILGGFQSRYRTVQRKVTYENAKVNTSSTQIQVQGEVVRAYENFRSLKKAYSAGVTGLESSKIAYNLEKERFNLGITSFVDFANANKTYVQAQTDMALAKYRFLFQKVTLDYALGTLTPESIPE